MTYTLIQALRGVLCICVVLIHIKIYLTKQGGDLSLFWHIPDLFGGIPCGFFAISGYFMAFLVDRNSPHFLVHRLLRVYPMYFIAVGIAYVLRFCTSSHLDTDDLFYVLSLLPFGMGKSYKLGIEWTLVYEIWYYFICAVFCNQRLKSYFPSFLITWLFGVMITDIYFFRIPQPVPNIFTVWFAIWNYSFIMGALTYYYLQRKYEPDTMAWAAIVALGSTATFSYLHGRAYSVLYWLGILACLLIDWLIRLESRIRAPKFLAQLGDYSYTLYLIHSNIIILVFYSWKSTTGTPPGTIAGLMAFVLCMGGFWYLGQVDVRLHKYLKFHVNKALADGWAAAGRRYVLAPLAALVSSRSSRD
ncbi:hypothetical protein NNJEOMEG_00222 [Fundidesulfovibrio magnetotacticus]|uniref:Acyltransferase 3 domain-containing protein n=1 Tax=Fundidesulfovibrio magnetotacticus TaxID=2730080 RepID=A0A6V8LS13_9BACT|nr:acyltransferase [Fundidesulfovibrio magnetotacticus]GFK92397.1 hypothetical protein NNJEOMEG_00222 [Fundidesulfovibrio magnetotacticus]